MLIDARDLTEGETLETDLCVIGAGAAGISVALRFVSTQVRVVVLEEGGLPEEREGPGIYRIVDGFPPRLATDSYMRWGFGGNTNHWAGNCRPLDDADFEPCEWVAYSGWPIRRPQLQPFYEEAQIVCGLGDVRYYDVNACRPHLAHQPIDVDPAILTARVVQTCPVVSFARLYQRRLRDAANVRVCLHARAIRLEASARGDRVEAVQVGAAGGRRFRVSSRVFVLAGGGIANPRLLLCSNDVHPNGLANEHDIVGRFFMEHPYVDIGLGRRKHGLGRVPRRREQVGGTTVWNQLDLSEDLRRKERVSGMSVWFARPGMLTGAWDGLVRTLRPGRPSLDDPGAGAAGANDTAGDAGAVFRRVSRSLTRRAARVMPGAGYLLRVELEQAPDPRNRVRLSSERDRFGQPRAELVFGLADEDLRRQGRALRIAADELGLDGGRVADQMDTMFRTGHAGFFWHHMGTTRMHTDPKQGVVNSDCRVHGVSNLFVAGSSVFPTGGTAAPTLTIVALALRLAEHIRPHFA